MEEWGGRHWRRAALLVAFLVVGFTLILGLWPRDESPPVVPRSETALLDSDSLRREVGRLSAIVDSLAGCTPENVREAKREIVQSLVRTIRPCMERRELAIYPVVDEHVGGNRLFTEAMRREHGVLNRWIDELASAGIASDTDAFCRRARALIGLLEAHLHLEEEVVLPLFDRAVTPEDIRARNGDRLRRGAG